MNKTLILTPNSQMNCGMFQLAQDLAKEFDGDIKFKGDFNAFTDYNQWEKYEIVITLLYPMHGWGKDYKVNSTHQVKLICYDQKIPPVTKTYFPNFWRRQAMRYINWRNNATMQGADEYWDVTEREQKPRWTKKHTDFRGFDTAKPYALYLGRKTDYKNFNWLQKTMQELNISLLFFDEPHNDDWVHYYLSNAKMLVTASLWEGYGRTPQEAEVLGIPAVAYDVGAHKRHIKKGICVHLDIDNIEVSEALFKEAVLKIWSI